MRVLRSKHQVIAAGKELHNCAASYALAVEQKRLILVVLRNPNGRAVAMGHHNLHGAWPRGGWIDIREACNKQPSEETLEHFRIYRRIFRQWHSVHFAPNVHDRRRRPNTIGGGQRRRRRRRMAMEEMMKTVELFI
jgi:hypothetical protein